MQRLTGTRTYLFLAIWGRGQIDLTSLDILLPLHHTIIKHSIASDRGKGPGFGLLETKVVIPGEAGYGEDKGAVAKRQANIGEKVNLLELQRVEVVGDRIVRRVLEVFGSRNG